MMLIETTNGSYLPMDKVDMFYLNLNDWEDPEAACADGYVMARVGTEDYHLAELNTTDSTREFLRWLMEREYVGDKLITQKRIREFLEHYHTKMV